MVRAADAGVKLMAVEMKACSRERRTSMIFPARPLSSRRQQIFLLLPKRERERLTPYISPGSGFLTCVKN
jgi:hypothetical protein